MKKEVLNELEKINEAKKMPEDVKKGIIIKIYRNVIIAIIIISYFLLLFLENNMAEKAVQITGFNVFSFLLLLVAIIVFEVSYKKDDDELAIHGIEILISAIVTLFMPYMYFEATGKIKTLYMLMPIYVGIYYLIKIAIIGVKENKKYKKSNSEIKELIKKEEKKEIDLEEKRKNRKNAIEDLSPREEIEEPKADEKSIEDIEVVPTKKSENVKKETKKTSKKPVSDIKKTLESEKKTTKVATNKKSEKNVEKIVTDEQKLAEIKEKTKRGRPKKVSNNK